MADKLDIDWVRQHLTPLKDSEFIPATEFIPVTQATLEEIEKEGDFNLPVDYKRFIQSFGCCVPTRKKLFELEVYIPPTESLKSDLSWMSKRDDGKQDVCVFYGMPGEHLTGVLGYREYYSERMPPTLLPIGSTSQGDQICLGVGGEELGKIFLWDEDLEIEWEDFATDDLIPREVMFWNVYRVSPSFSEFLSLIV